MEKEVERKRMRREKSGGRRNLCARGQRGTRQWSEKQGTDRNRMRWAAMAAGTRRRRRARGDERQVESQAKRQL
ncbi:hypothetical protein RUM43_000025 [Polyplax serrata]|uniref:Uncharacterized protein n=1 Tax=Polyplax serrata TaxID=468196 RepID=A0AAN8SET4_POLSC